MVCVFYADERQSLLQKSLEGILTDRDFQFPLLGCNLLKLYLVPWILDMVLGAVKTTHRATHRSRPRVRFSHGDDYLRKRGLLLLLCSKGMEEVMGKTCKTVLGPAKCSTSRRASEKLISFALGLGRRRRPTEGRITLSRNQAAWWLCECPT